uniref:Uncharacterized protein n=1 Tax=Arundo donax TaxID=35708 RepID=A0A0A9HRL9_ARUDO
MTGAKFINVKCPYYFSFRNWLAYLYQYLSIESVLLVQLIRSMAQW